MQQARPLDAHSFWKNELDKYLKSWEPKGYRKAQPALIYVVDGAVLFRFWADPALYSVTMEQLLFIHRN